MIIGLIGTIAAGKNLVSEYLISKGFQHIILSDFIREELREENKLITRKNLQDKGNELRLKFGSEILAIKSLEKINKENAVIDGIRNLAEVSEIKNKKGIIIGMDAPAEIRWKRYEKGERENIKTYEEFVEKDLRDRKEKIDHGLQVDKCLEKAEFMLFNKNKEEIKEEIDKIIKWKK